MIELYLVRHAIAEDRDPGRWPDDSLRPLTADGVARFERAARGLKRLAPDIDAVLASPFARAWATAEILEREAGWPAPVQAAELAAMRSPVDALALLEESGSAAIALVGHEPSLSALASLLLTGAGDSLEIELKKGGVIALGLPGPTATGAAFLRWAATPRLLRGLAAG